MNNEEKILEILMQMQSDVSGLKSDVSELKTKVDNIEVKVDALETKVDALETKVDALQEDMSEVKLNVRFLWEEYERQDKRIDRIAK